ncbi:hypothetical protein SAMN05421848_1703 [Kushneria avicenniae]|uniref:Uncharacterized protein n=1 Tax=Kushneria avicenniae TaxID=402385 RepID=A0A1I1JS45_9GAMM|nr:hypothetical protein [Kushneria avicenniae]SFC50782.1 hypothetical protein SAMN05421848_1703 [Kushneria avicenniae]
MSIFWDSNASVKRNVGAWFFIAFLLTAALSLYFNHFVANPHTVKIATYISIAFTIITFPWIISRLARKSNQNKKWHNIPRWKKLATLLALPFLIFSVFWLNLALAFPHAYTQVFGTSMARSDIIHKEEGINCNYQVTLDSVDALFFEFCIDQENFDRMSDGPQSADIMIKESSLGYIVTGVGVMIDR